MAAARLRQDSVFTQLWTDWAVVAYAARMAIYAISGSHGFIGRALAAHLQREGHTLRPVLRTPDGFDWSPLDGADGVFHLAGRNISARWTRTFKATMLAERSAGVESLYRALATLKRPPQVCVIASAIGFYGDTHTYPDGADELSPAGSGFAAQLCRQLETFPPLPRTRCVFARLGVVLAPHGGALARMLPPFRFGLGGPLGPGTQRMSWISLPDAARALAFAAHTPELTGPVNLAAPHPTTNRDFTRALAHALGRPALLPMPAPVVRLLFGDMGHSLLLTDAAVRPTVLLQHGFAWHQPDIQPTLTHLLT